MLACLGKATLRACTFRHRGMLGKSNVDSSMLCSGFVVGKKSTFTYAEVEALAESAPFPAKKETPAEAVRVCFSSQQATLVVLFQTRPVLCPSTYYYTQGETGSHKKEAMTNCY